MNDSLLASQKHFRWAVSFTRALSPQSPFLSTPESLLCVSSRSQKLCHAGDNPLFKYTFSRNRKHLCPILSKHTKRPFCKLQGGSPTLFWELLEVCAEACWLPPRWTLVLSFWAICIPYPSTHGGGTANTSLQRKSRSHRRPIFLTEVSAGCDQIAQENK